MSYGDDGSDYTRGVGAIASIDRGAKASKGGGAVRLPRALRATTNFSRRPARSAPLIIIDEPRRPALVYGQNVPWPVGLTGGFNTGGMQTSPGMVIEEPPLDLLDPNLPSKYDLPQRDKYAQTLPSERETVTIPPEPDAETPIYRTTVTIPPEPDRPVVISTAPPKAGVSKVLIVGGVVVGVAILYFMMKKR